MISSEALGFKPRNHSVVSQREEFLPAGAHSDHVVTFIVFIFFSFFYFFMYMCPEVEFIWKRVFMLTWKKAWVDIFFKEETLCQTTDDIHSTYIVYVE